MHPDGIETLTARMPHAPRLREALLAMHRTTKEVGKAAAETDVKTLVLNHFVPGDDPAVTDEMWRADPSKVFGKLLFVGRDLQTM
jgi:ribonuclease BN (tRNA processing enzyme)